MDYAGGDYQTADQYGMAVWLHIKVRGRWLGLHACSDCDTVPLQ